MLNAVEVWAPWADDKDRELINHINRMPIYLRKPKARPLGERLRVTNQERELLKLKTIKPFDMTDEELKELRRAKDRARKQQARRRAGRDPREVYLANNRLSRTEAMAGRGHEPRRMVPEATRQWPR